MKVFVYGTLLSGCENHDRFLAESEFVCEGMIRDFALYNLGWYPGIKRSTGDMVKGEVYEVDQITMERLHALEGEGSLYEYIRTDVICGDDLITDVGTYVYLRKVEEESKMEFVEQPWGKQGRDVEKDDLVWYASYGSNMLMKRFMHYIEGGVCEFNGKEYRACADRSAPKEVRKITIPYEMYFGNAASSWGPGGVAFLDLGMKAETPGKMYLITREQMEHVHNQEGRSSNWYDRRVTLGECDGIEIVNVTNSGRRPECAPSEKYAAVVKAGLEE